MKLPRLAEIVPLARDVLSGAAMIRLADPTTQADMHKRLEAARRAFVAIMEIVEPRPRGDDDK